MKASHIFTIADDGQYECALAERKGWGKSQRQEAHDRDPKARNVELARFIYALGIRNVGQTTAKDIAKHFKTVSAFFAVLAYENGFEVSDLRKVDGIGPVVLASLDAHFNIEANYEEVFALRVACDIQDVPQGGSRSASAARWRGFVLHRWIGPLEPRPSVPDR
jgi:DNA ligase (NAD+)